MANLSGKVLILCILGVILHNHNAQATPLTEQVRSLEKIKIQLTKTDHRKFGISLFLARNALRNMAHHQQIPTK